MFRIPPIFFLFSLCLVTLLFAQGPYEPLGRTAYTTSSFAENRGTRYHAGVDYSTEMQEGWPLLAPADGTVEFMATSPFGYGKHLRFRTENGYLWVFAHLAGFHAPLDSLDFQFKAQHQVNRSTLTPQMRFKKGDTLAFSGSTGIGNPHLHVEWRTPGGNHYQNPCASGMACTDTVTPSLFAIALQKDKHYAFTSAPQIAGGCLEIPNGFTSPSSVNMAFKIADYSREPYSNPMSIYRLTLRQNHKKVYHKQYDSLVMTAMLPIRDELLWSEESDTAGDWHATSFTYNPKQPLEIEIEDFNKNIYTQALTAQTHCPTAPFHLPVKHQDSLLFTFLARPWISVNACDQGHWEAWGKNAKKQWIQFSNSICQTFQNAPYGMVPLHTISSWRGQNVLELRWVQGTDTLRRVHFEGANGVQQRWVKPGKTRWPLVTAWQKRAADSLQPARWEFHPKGMQIWGSWELCIDTTQAPHPLYWQGETTRQWFIFSQQTLNTKGQRCVSLNEHRDIASLLDTLPPTLGTPYEDSLLAFGRYTKSLRIPLMDNLSGPDFACLSASDTTGRWIPLDYDSEPKELVFNRQHLPPPGQNIRLNVCDEAGNKNQITLKIPGSATPEQRMENRGTP